MSKKYCVTCGVKPRKISRSGKQMTKCVDCLRDYWRKKKRETHGYQPRKPKQEDAETKTEPRIETVSFDAPTVRRCQQCKTTKPVEDFRRWGMNYRRTCKACESAKNPPTKKGTHILLVADGQVLLTQLLSQTPAKNTRNMLIKFYENQGYRIEHVFERMVSS